MDYLPSWPPKLQPRKWQLKAVRRIDSLSKQDALVVATPGAGKTMFALLVAHQFLKEGLIERIVIVCPSDHLKVQWAQAAARVGIDLDPRWSNADGVESEDYMGVVVTYQQVASLPDIFRMNCKRPTLVILDEIHHAGDDLSWGASLRHAFERAIFRLSLSGTPFRSDNNPIPFVTYEEGRSRPDFEYGYGDALADNVCRPVYFPCFEGHMEWVSRDGTFKERSLLDPVSSIEATERLNTALDPAGDWLRTVIREADRKLTEIRADGHRLAGGLIIARDQLHAKRVAELVRTECGEEPVLVISESSDSSEKIRRFAEGAERWIIAVRMVSEGVDIPRLRVGVYATNVMTELFFRQAVGRLIRMLEGLEEQSAWFYLPAVEPLINFARDIREERDHELEEEIERSLEEDERRARGEGADGTLESLFTPLASEPAFHDVIFDGASFDEEEIAFAESVGRSMGIRLPPLQVAALLRRGATEAGGHILYRNKRDAQADTQLLTEPPKFDRKRQLRNIIQRQANQLAYLKGCDPHDIHSEWIAQGGRPQAQATEEELERKRDWLIGRMREARGWPTTD